MKNTTMTRDIARPHNCYNVFFILERAYLLEALCPSSSSSSSGSTSNAPAKAAALTGYEFLDLPPLPPRYRHLEGALPSNWYDPGRNRVVKRKHTRKHGVASFKEIARHVAASWRSVDRPTRDFVDEVARLLKGRYRELEDMGGVVCLDVSAAAPAAPAVLSAERASPSPAPGSFTRTITADAVKSGGVASIADLEGTVAAAADALAMPFPQTTTSGDGVGAFARRRQRQQFRPSFAATVAQNGSAPFPSSSGNLATWWDPGALAIDRDLILDPANPIVASGLCGTVTPETAPKPRLGMAMSANAAPEDNKVLLDRVKSLDDLISANVEACASSLSTTTTSGGRGKGACREVDCTDRDIWEMYRSL